VTRDFPCSTSGKLDEAIGEGEAKRRGRLGRLCPGELELSEESESFYRKLVEDKLSRSLRRHFTPVLKQTTILGGKELDIEANTAYSSNQKLK